VAGLNSSTAPLPNKADQSVINDEDIEVLKEVARKILRLSDDESEAMEIVRTGHCFRPATNSGRPVSDNSKGETLDQLSRRWSASQYISEISTRSLAEDIAFEDGAGAWLSAGHGARRLRRFAVGHIDTEVLCFAQGRGASRCLKAQVGF
jgi:hypothetical protein